MPTTSLQLPLPPRAVIVSRHRSYIDDRNRINTVVSVAAANDSNRYKSTIRCANVNLRFGSNRNPLTAVAH